MIWPFLVAALASTAGGVMQNVGAAQAKASPPTPGQSMGGVHTTPQYLIDALARADDESEELSGLYGDQGVNGVLSYLQQVLGRERPQIPNEFLGGY